MKSRTRQTEREPVSEPFERSFAELQADFDAAMRDYDSALETLERLIIEDSKRPLFVPS